MTLSEELFDYIAACFTGIWLESHEHNEAILELGNLFRQLRNLAPARLLPGFEQSLLAAPSCLFLFDLQLSVFLLQTLHL